MPLVSKGINLVHKPLWIALPAWLQSRRSDEPSFFTPVLLIDLELHVGNVEVAGLGNGYSNQSKLWNRQHDVRESESPHGGEGGGA